jgi:hypothetical protein
MLPLDTSVRIDLAFLRWYASRRFLLTSTRWSSVIAARGFLLFVLISFRCSLVIAARRVLSLCLLRSLGSTTSVTFVSKLHSLWPPIFLTDRKI